MDHVVASIDSISDDVLDALSLNPRLSVNIVDVTVSAEEGIVHTGLVHSHPHLLRWFSNEAWDVSTSKNVSTKTILHDHLDRAVHLLIFSKVISGPVSTELLRA